MKRARERPRTRTQPLRQCRASTSSSSWPSEAPSHQPSRSRKGAPSDPDGKPDRKRRKTEKPPRRSSAAAAASRKTAEAGRSLLHLAAGKGDVDAVRRLLSAGVDVNETNYLEPGHELLRGMSCTPLHVAAGTGRLEVVKELVAAGADLSSAVAQDPSSRKKLKKEKKQHPEQQWGEEEPSGSSSSSGIGGIDGKVVQWKPLLVGTTALHLAAFLGRTQVVEALLEAGAPVDAQTAAGTTPLLQALSNGHQDAASALLRAGADPNHIGSAWKITPLSTVASACCKVPDRIAALRMLVDAGADVNLFDHGAAMPLQIAVMEGDEAMVKALLEAGADANIASGRGSGAEQGDRPLLTAIAAQNLPLVSVLVASGADVALAHPGTGSTALGTAITSGNGRIVRALLDAGASPNAPQRNGTTPLALSVSAGSPGVVGALLDAGADANQPSGAGGITPLISAVIDRSAAVVRRLLAAGADPNLGHKGTGTTALSHAVRNGDVGVVRELVASGADVNGLYSNGMTPLITAITDGDERMVAALLEAGADQNLISGSGFSPLMIASMYERTELVRVLLGAGANPNQTSNNNNMPLDFAVHHGNREISLLLLDHGARLNGTSDNTASKLVPWLQEERSNLRDKVSSLVEGLPHWCAVAASHAAATKGDDAARGQEGPRRQLRNKKVRGPLSAGKGCSGTDKASDNPQSSASGEKGRQQQSLRRSSRKRMTSRAECPSAA